MAWRFLSALAYALLIGTVSAGHRLKCNEYVISVWSRGVSAADLKRHVAAPKADPNMHNVAVSCGVSGEHVRKFSIADLPWDALASGTRGTRKDTMCVRVQCSKRTHQVQKVIALDACPEDQSLEMVPRGRVLRVSLGVGAWYNSLRWADNLVWDASTETNREVDGDNCIPLDLTKVELRKASQAAIEQCEMRLKAEPNTSLLKSWLKKPLNGTRKMCTKRQVQK